MQSLTTLSDTIASSTGESDQARFNEISQNTENKRIDPAVRGVGLFVLLVLVLFVTGLSYGGYFYKLRTYISAPIESYLLTVGVTLKKIHISGQVNLKDEQIIAALGIKPGQSLFGFDAHKAQTRLMDLGQVKSARVMRQLPSTLLVQLEERLPFARWLRNGRVHLVDREGVVLTELKRGEKNNYPLIVGIGGGKKAAELIRILSVHEHLAQRIKMAEWVSQYRWNLHARSGVIIKLPPDGVALGLARFVSLPDWQALLARKNLSVDLRQRTLVFVSKTKTGDPVSISNL